LQGYSRQPNGVIDTVKRVINDIFTPAAGLITTAEDLVLWNENLHSGKLLSNSLYKQMTTGSSVRNHPIFGEIPYGYGVQMDASMGISEIGHGGYTPGFAATNFYYPKTKVSVLVLENLDWKDEAFKQTFFFETQIRQIVRESYLVVKCN
jgi:CubicO group peptidase (beta-lactamase class C family)